MPRVYAVENENEVTLVTAESQAQALGHVVKSQYKVRVASAMDVVEYMNAGGKVEEATGSPATSPDPAEAPSE